MNRNYGFNPRLEQEHQQDTDWVFGAASQQCRALIPPAKRITSLPQGEVQRGKEDWMDCASRGPVNLLEAKFNYLDSIGALTKDEVAFLKPYRSKKGRIEFSDRFIAIKSGTTRFGNSLKAPVDAVHRSGLIPKAQLPAKSSMTWDQYHDPKGITSAMEDLGREFLKRFPINYERVYLADYPQIIPTDMIVVAGYAWPQPINGVYPRTTLPLNHAFLYLLAPAYCIFDNYEEAAGDFLKQLAPDYALLDYGYRLFIGTKLEELPQPLISQSLLSKILQMLREGRALEVLDLLKRTLGNVFKL